MRLLLDTCAFLWITTSAPELSRRAREAFEDPTNEVFVSTVSTWEIAIKHAIGRLRMPRPPHVYVPQLRQQHGIQSLPLEEEATLYLPQLPALHQDPFDRMLVCQAIVSGLVIMTPDVAITNYAVRSLW